MAALNLDLRFFAGSMPSPLFAAMTREKVSRMLTVLSVCSDPAFLSVMSEPFDTFLLRCWSDGRVSNPCVLNLNISLAGPFAAPDDTIFLFTGSKFSICAFLP